MQILMGFFRVGFALCISSTSTFRGVHQSVHTDIHKKPVFLAAPVLLLHLAFGIPPPPSLLSLFV